MLLYELDIQLLVEVGRLHFGRQHRLLLARMPCSSLRGQISQFWFAASWQVILKPGRVDVGESVCWSRFVYPGNLLRPIGPCTLVVFPALSRFTVRTHPPLTILFGGNFHVYKIVHIVIHPGLVLTHLCFQKLMAILLLFQLCNLFSSSVLCLGL